VYMKNLSCSAKEYFSDVTTMSGAGHAHELGELCRGDSAVYRCSVYLLYWYKPRLVHIALSDDYPADFRISRPRFAFSRLTFACVSP
jgi:hypothetical protein